MTEHPKRRDIRQAGVALVERSLTRLGLAPTYIIRDGISYRTLPDGLGWCQALYAPEEAWPPGADLCVIVSWLPDTAYRRDSRTGYVPAGTETHWRERIEATVMALRSAGYLAAMTGPPRAPRLHASEDILVWRLGPGDVDEWPPFGAWEGAAPARPNFECPQYRYPECNPVHLVDDALRTARRQRGDQDQDVGSVYVRDVKAALWPPFAEMCARVLWRPAPRFRCAPNGLLSAGAEDHWRAGVTRVRRDLEDAGYQVREAEQRPSPELDEGAGLLVWSPSTWLPPLARVVGHCGNSAVVGTGSEISSN